METHGWNHAACQDGDELLDVFFSNDLRDIAQAKRICAGCPLLVTCLEGALERSEPYGVWGGQLFRDGQILAVKRSVGRPPKHPRPGDRLPEVPVPEHLRDLVLLRTA
jgi:WhiB family redox-sensing transcriptional regulator